MPGADFIDQRSGHASTTVRAVDAEVDQTDLIPGKVIKHVATQRSSVVHVYQERFRFGALRETLAWQKTKGSSVPIGKSEHLVQESDVG
jgi:hypothetical protein